MVRSSGLVNSLLKDAALSRGDTEPTERCEVRLCRPRCDRAESAIRPRSSETRSLTVSVGLDGYHLLDIDRGEGLLGRRLLHRPGMTYRSYSLLHAH